MTNEERVSLKDIESFLMRCAKEKRIIIGIEAFLITESNSKIPQAEMIADFSRHAKPFDNFMWRSVSKRSEVSVQDASRFFQHIRPNENLIFEFEFAK